MKVLCMIESRGFLRGAIYNVTRLTESMKTLFAINEYGEEQPISYKSSAFEIL